VAHQCGEPAFKTGKALGDKRRLNLYSRLDGQCEFAELVDLAADGIADPTTFGAISAVGTLITHSLVLRTISKLWFSVQM